MRLLGCVSQAQAGDQPDPASLPPSSLAPTIDGLVVG